MIGYYVHHHGSGHRSRFEAVAPLLRDVTAISELDIPGGLRLPSDVPSGAIVDPCADGAFHWVPLHPDAAGRLQILTAWLASRHPAGVVVDVSVEAAISCRLAGVPTVMVRQLGRRCDRAHELGYRVCDRLIAPWPEELDEDASGWIRDKTVYVGYLGGERIESCDPATRHVTPLTVGPDDIVVLWGRGGGRLSAHALGRIADVCDGTVWCVGMDVVNADSGCGSAPNVTVVGWRDDIDSILRSAPVVVASAGNNVIASAARWGCPLVLLPQTRPFAEQQVHARRLATLGAAVSVEDADREEAWSERFATARQRAGRLAAMYEVGGARRFADAIESAFGSRVDG